MVWEQRWHPLRREWVVVTSHRDNRPWRGAVVEHTRPPLPSYVPECYLCPGNERVSGHRNDTYDGVFVFDNDHPCVGPAAPTELESPAGIYRNQSAAGISRVVCFSPRHDVTLAELSSAEIARLLTTLQEQQRDLAARAGIRNVLMFENKGEVVGVSNPHPHCQIYATNFVFKTIELEAETGEAYLREHDRVLFQDVIASEIADGRRILTQKHRGAKGDAAGAAGALAFVPYFARYAYETFVAPMRTHASIADLSDAEIESLAVALRETLIRLENLWCMALPYVMVLHQAPTDGREYPGFHFHIEIYPPLRKPGLLKYLAGPEIGGGNFLNDTSPEAKAAELRAVSSTHYKHGSAHA